MDHFEGAVLNYLYPNGLYGVRLSILEMPSL